MSLLDGIRSGLRGLFGGGYPHAQGEVFVAQGDDDALNAAMDAARASLPSFWARFEAKDRQAYALKVKLPTDHGGSEHLWITPAVVADTGVIAGVLLNDPMDIEALHAGSSIVVEPSQVSDWGYWSGQTLFGNFTTRALLPSHTRDEQAYLGSVLSKNPVETA